MNDSTKGTLPRSAYPRLDALDSITIPEVSTDFLMFVRDDPSAFFAFVVLGMFECGATRPPNYADMRDALERKGREAIETYVNHLMRKQEEEGES